MSPGNGQGRLALFRFDASPAIGGGHAMRCLTLADALAGAGWQCRFAVGPETPSTASGLSEHEGNILVLKGGAETGPDVIGSWLDGKCDLMVVDHYGLDAGFEKACRSFAGRILAIDDLADRPHDCDIILDQTFRRAVDDYLHLAPPGCRVMTGSRYALLRPDFAARRAQSLGRRKGTTALRRILVSFGATDPDNMTAVALEGIAESGLDVHVEVVIGSSAPHLKTVMQTAETATRDISVIAGAAPWEVADAMVRADLAIGATGTSSWERCCLGLPGLVIVCADNQLLIAEGIAQAGAVEIIGRSGDVGKDDVARALGGIASDMARVGEMSAAAAAICDGEGVGRVVDVIGEVL